MTNLLMIGKLKKIICLAVLTLVYLIVIKPELTIASEEHEEEFELTSMPGVTYRIKKNGVEREAVLNLDIEGWERNEAYSNGLIIPEIIEHDGEEYLVTELTDDNGHIYISGLSKVEFPATIKKISARNITIEGYSIPIIFRCSSEAFSDVQHIGLDESAIESIIYCPDNELEEYKNLMDKICKVTFYDTEDFHRSYCGLAVAKIGEENVIPLAFHADSGYYKILNSKKKTVALICADFNTTYMEGIYEQPGTVSYRGNKYHVTLIEYFAFHMSRCGIKLPSTVKKLSTECFGQHVKMVDLSETKIKKIKKNLFLDYGDNDSSEPEVAEVILPESCTDIERKAFYRCKKLRSITIPSKVKTIGYKAFYKKCKNYYILGDILPKGINRQYMKSSIVYVKSDLIDEAKEILKDKIKMGRCTVEKLK